MKTNQQLYVIKLAGKFVAGDEIYAGLPTQMCFDIVDAKKYDEIRANELIEAYCIKAKLIEV